MRKANIIKNNFLELDKRNLKNLAVVLYKNKANYSNYYEYKHKDLL
jgi:hypothetical protein